MKWFFKFLILIYLVFLSQMQANECVKLPMTGENAVRMLSNQTKNVDGLFVQIGNGAFDWIYVGIDGSYAAKLEGIDDNNYFIWTFIYGYGGKGIDGVEILNNKTKVKFGNASGGNTNISSKIAGKTFNVAGLFLHYGNGAFDWVYSEPNGQYLAKLEGKDKKTGYFIWTFLQYGNTKSFKNFEVSQDKTEIHFGEANQFCPKSYYSITESDISGTQVSIDIDNSNEADDLYFCPNHNYKISGTDDNGIFTDYGTWSISDGKIVVQDSDGTSTITLDDQPMTQTTGSFISQDENGTFSIISVTDDINNSACAKSSSSSEAGGGSEGSSSSSGLEMPPTPPDLNSSSSSGGVDMPPSPPQI